MSVIKGKGPLIDPGLCRCCGTMKKCRLLNVEYEHLGKKEIYSDMVMDCYGLVLSHLDTKPTERLVCATCVSRLREAYSFRKQVLRCEEAFLQMKMCYNDDDNQNKIIMARGEGPKLQIEIVKMEPDDKMSVAGSLAGDALDDTNDYACEEIKVEDAAEKNSDSDDMPLAQQVKRPRVSNGQSPSKQNSKRSALKARSPRLHLDTRTNNKQSLSKVQQLIRERDPSYMTETNILTIVEFSYVVPFKCRHNNLICYYCGQHFSDPQLLREHSTNDHHPKKFRVIEHKKMIKIDMTRIDCRLCPTSIDNIDEFKRHITSVHGKKYYFDFSDSVLPFKLTKDESKCALCDEVFPYFHALNKHMNKHFSNYVCETCGLGFVDNGRFFMHQQRHEGGDFPCEICGKVFKASYNKDLHVDRVHKKKGRVFCPKCDEKLMSYPQKLKHLVEVHGEEPLSFSCKLCERVFETRRMLTLHRRKEHLKDFRYECQYCGQKFFTRFALNNHLPTHTGERNYKCKVCEKTYPRLKTLKDHMRIHTNDRRYRCHICGQAFIQNCSLKGHMKSQHPEYG